eukprot:TRINITY_DN10857_c0_g1_i1.p1 TRINITY_DN10857_c0_g1~~TRINITY_DN10857_c0_g1_i1.p1  ORF type:complete len:635 (-),score=101.27 TRINITY_DN10857_c0_g1_i1:175-2079(-)
MYQPAGAGAVIVEMDDPANCHEGGYTPAPTPIPHNGPQSYSSGVVLSWEDLSYSVQVRKDKKQILSNITGHALPGELLAIMGPSGSGKSSLLGCLLNRTPVTGGTIKLNSRPSSQQTMRHVAAFVPQDDTLLGFLTVEETIRFSAGLHLALPADQRNVIVESIIQALGLSHIRKSKVGSVVVRGVSGGERRRVSIGVELVSQKPLIFLDEPTSGLDSAASYQVVSLLKRFAASHLMTVVCTIHQPSSQTFEMFDKLALLAYGRTVFFGRVGDVASHFAEIGHPVPAHTNTADHFIQLINADFREDKDAARKEIGELTDISVGHLPADSFGIPAGSNEAPLPKGGYGTSIFRQVAVLTQRGFINAQRNFVMYWIRVAMYIALAILMGTIWLRVGTSFSAVQNRLGAHFFAIAFPCFMAVAGIPAFLEEKAVFDREYSSGCYYALSYVIALTVTSLPFIFLIAMVFSSIVYPLVGLHKGATYFFRYVLVLFLSLYSAESMTLAVAGIFPIFVVALALAAFANGFYMLLEGFFIRYKDVPGFWIWGHYLSYQKYGFEALLRNDLTGLVFDCATVSATECSCVYPDALNAICKFEGLSVLRSMDYQNVSIGAWCGVLIGMCVGYRVIFWLSLLLRRSR